MEATLAKLVEMGSKLMAYGANIPQLELMDDESKLLGDAIAECAMTLPSKKVKAIDQLLGKIMPWVGLVGAVAVVGVPRWQFYRAVQADRRFNPALGGAANVRTGENGGTARPASASDGNAVAASSAEETVTVVEGGAGIAIAESLGDDSGDAGLRI